MTSKKPVASEQTILLLALLNDEQYSMLPEILQVFGTEYTIKFLEVFAGTTLNVPNKKRLLQSMKEVDIYLSIQRNHASRKDISNNYAITNAGIDSVVRRVSDLVDNNDSLKKLIR